MLNHSDTELIADYLKNRDAKSLEILIQRYLKSVYNFILRMISFPRETEDITQETFLRAWKNLKKFDQTKNFKTWIFRIARNAAIDFLRKKKTLSFSEFETSEGDNPLLDNLADPAPLASEISERQDTGKTLSRALKKLSPQYQTTLLLHYSDGLAFREIAEILGEPLHTIKSRHRRALIKLKKLLKEDKNL